MSSNNEKGEVDKEKMCFYNNFEELKERNVPLEYQKDYGS